MQALSIRIKQQTVCSSGNFNLVHKIFRYSPAGICGFIDDSKGEIDRELDLDKLNLSEID